jgi:hypothetical protein
MIDILGLSQAFLRENEYRTRLVAYRQESLLSFEDESILGFCFQFGSPNALLEGWETAETDVLNGYGARFRSAGEKSWNVYSVFLCASVPTTEEARRVRWIEENLDRTRKIALCGITTRTDLQRALLPLLRLQYRPILKPEAFNDRLERRIASIAPAVANVALKPDIPPNEVVRLLGGLK